MAHALKAIALGLLPLGAATMMTAPAAAQSRAGIAVANIDQAVAQSRAYTTARGQMETTYKAQIDQFNARKTALDADLTSKRTTLEAALRAAGGKPTPALQTQYEALQASSQSAQAELQRLGQPVAIAQAYVEEQIGAKLSDALKAAMSAAKVDLIIKPEAAVSYQPAVDITQQVRAQLDTLVPNVSITPPAGWRPGGQQAQGQAPAAAAPAAPAGNTPSARPQGR